MTRAITETSGLLLRAPGEDAPRRLRPAAPAPLPPPTQTLTARDPDASDRC